MKTYSKISFTSTGKTLVATILCCCTLISQQTLGQFVDDFSDGDFTNNPVWTGSLSHFKVNASYQLQLSNTVAGTSSLVVPFSFSELGESEWRFNITQLFASSSNNYSRVYLMSDQQNLTSPLNGYYLQFGESGSTDAVELFRQTGSSSTSVCRATTGRIANAFNITVKVKRSATGIWELFVDYNNGGITFTLEASGTDNTHTSTSYFGIRCTYTITNASAFGYDNFVVSATSAPEPVLVGSKDIVVTEIFADFSPSEGLPEAEFIELFNRSDKSIDLAGWKITDGNTVGTLSSTILPPDEYLILSLPSSQSLFSSFGKTIGVPSFPSLNNAGDVLWLKDSYGHTIDSLSYSLSSYKNDEKKDGGWTLELIDPENFCKGDANWTASIDPAGGTPGHQNSVYTIIPDHAGPKLLRASVVAPKTLTLEFDEKLSAVIPSKKQFFNRTSH